MAFIDRKEQPAAGPRGFDIKDEGFSEEYRSFLTRRCRAQIGTDGIFRDPVGRRYCSCEMCGRTGSTDLMGKLYCDYHFEYRGNPFEENICTVTMHKLRPLILIEESLSKFGVLAHDSDKEIIETYEQMFNAACDRLGVERLTPGGNMFVHICNLIDDAIKTAQGKAVREDKKELKEAERRRDLDTQLRSLKNHLRMSRPIAPNFSKNKPPHPAEAADDFPL